MPSTLYEEVIRYFPNAQILSVYGSTETGGIYADFRDFQKNIHTGHLNCIVKLIDCDENRCSRNTNGEVCVKMKHQFFGYVDDSDANELVVDSEAFFRTGDVGHFDDNNYLCVEGRKTDLIQIFHFNCAFFPFEIEEKIIKSQEIKEVCVTGIPVSNDRALPAAVVVRNGNSSITEKDVFDIVAGSYSYSIEMVRPLFSITHLFNDIFQIIFPIKWNFGAVFILLIHYLKHFREKLYVARSSIWPQICLKLQKHLNRSINHCYLIFQKRFGRCFKRKSL